MNHPTKAAMSGIRRYADGLDLNFSMAADMHFGRRRLGELFDGSSICVDVNATDRLLTAYG